MGGNAQPQQPQYGGAPDLYRQYQQFAPGSAGAQDLTRQMQGSDNGAAFNANMKSAGWKMDDLGGGNYGYQQPQQSQSGGANAKGGGPPQAYQPGTRQQGQPGQNRK